MNVNELHLSARALRQRLVDVGEGESVNFVRLAVFVAGNTFTTDTSTVKVEDAASKGIDPYLADFDAVTSAVTATKAYVVFAAQPRQANGVELLKPVIDHASKSIVVKAVPSQRSTGAVQVAELGNGYGFGDLKGWTIRVEDPTTPEVIKKML